MGGEEKQGSSSNNKERQSSKETNSLTKTPVAFGARFQFRDIVSSHNVMQWEVGWGAAERQKGKVSLAVRAFSVQLHSVSH